MIRFSTAGESHGEALIALVSGLPAGVPVDLDFVNRELWRRQQGYGRGGRMKIETDKAHVLSGVRQFRLKSSTATGRTGRKSCPLQRAIRTSIRPLPHHVPDTPTSPER
jgi:chorismate synthase